MDGPDDPLSAYLRDYSRSALAEASAVPSADAIHATRVATRRLRSTLRVFPSLLDLEEPEAREADEELRWFAGLLGEVRDRQVQRRRFASALAELPPDQVLGPVSSRIDDTLRSEQLAAEERLGKAMVSERYQALAALLTAWAERPPVGDAAPAALRKQARRAAKKAERRLAEAWESTADADLHRARKAAKRARYAGELLRPLGRGKKQRKRFKRIQGLLGDLQDAVVAEATLRRLVSGVPAAESGFTFGLLHAHEREEAERLRRVVCDTHGADRGSAKRGGEGRDR